MTVGNGGVTDSHYHKTDFCGASAASFFSQPIRDHVSAVRPYHWAGLC